MQATVAATAPAAAMRQRGRWAARVRAAAERGRGRLLAALVAACACGPAAGAEFSLDLLDAFAFPTGVELAPTGDRVLVRWNGSLVTRRKFVRYEVLDRTGKALQRLDAAEETWSDAAWRPDGAAIALVGTRDKATRLALWTLADGEGPRNLEACRSGERAAAPAWSPDGDAIALYCVADPPEKDPDDGKDPDQAAPKVLLASAGTLFGVESPPADASARAVLLDLRGGRHEIASGPSLLAAPGSLVWLDRDTLMVVATGDGDWVGRPYNGSRIGTVHDRATGWAPRPDPLRWEGARVPQPVLRDGKQVLLQASGGGRRRGTTFEAFRRSYPFRLTLIDGDRREELFEASLDWFVPAGDVPWMPLSYYRQAYAQDTYYFLRTDRASARVVAFSMVDHAARELTPPELNITDFSISADGASMVAVQGSGELPDEVHWYDLRAGGASVRLTRVGEAVREKYRPAQLRLLRWRSNDDRFDVEGRLLLPQDHEPGRRHPLIVDIHGGPGAAFVNNFEWLRFDGGHQVPPELYALRGYAVLLVNPRGDPSYGDAYRNGLHQAWGAAVTEDIFAGVDEAIRLGIADPERLGVAGASYGGWATAYAISKSGRFKAASANDPVIDTQLAAALDYQGRQLSNYWLFAGYSGAHLLEGGLDAIDPVAVKTPILLRFGLLSGDPYRPSQFFVSGLEFFTYLHTHCRPVEMIVHPTEGHGIADRDTLRDYIARDLAWFDYWLLGKGTQPEAIRGLCAQGMTMGG